MKKINISSQLILLFFSIVLITSCAFSIIATTRINFLAEKEIYSRLSTYIYLLSNSEELDEHLNFPDMNVAYYINNSDIEYQLESNNLLDFINEEEMNKLLIEISSSNEYPLVKGLLESPNDDIYYVCLMDDLNNYTIVFTDGSYANYLIRSLGAQAVLVFFVIIFLSIYIIFFWSNKFVKRIKNLQEHILSLPKNKYQVSYNDDTLDEIGELSRSVENMRIEIEHNESTKQEMLQNLSHDFKTPIAVIKSYAEAQIDGMTDEESSKIIINQAEILKRKVNRLLQYNSLEYLKKDKEFEDVNMAELIGEIAINYKYLTEIDIELDLDDDVCFLGYKENFYTVIDNILDNAKRYAKNKIKIVLRKKRLRIYNDGDHIDEEFLNGMFKPYEKGSNGEFGLGMSIVKKTCDFFGYNLKVVNEEVGVSFIIENN